MILLTLKQKVCSKGIVLSQVGRWGTKEFIKEDKRHEHSAASSSRQTNRKFHCSSYPGTYHTLKMTDEPCAGTAIMRFLVNSKLNHRKETNVEDGMFLIEKVSPPPLNVNYRCSAATVEVITQETKH